MSEKLKVENLVSSWDKTKDSCWEQLKETSSGIAKESQTVAASGILMDL